MPRIIARPIRPVTATGVPGAAAATKPQPANDPNASLSVQDELELEHLMQHDTALSGAHAEDAEFRNFFKAGGDAAAAASATDAASASSADEGSVRSPYFFIGLDDEVIFAGGRISGAAVTVLPTPVESACALKVRLVGTEFATWEDSGKQPSANHCEQRGVFFEHEFVVWRGSGLPAGSSMFRFEAELPDGLPASCEDDRGAPPTPLTDGSRLAQKAQSVLSWMSDVTVAVTSGSSAAKSIDAIIGDAIGASGDLPPPRRPRSFVRYHAELLLLEAAACAGPGGPRSSEGSGPAGTGQEGSGTGMSEQRLAVVPFQAEERWTADLLSTPTEDTQSQVQHSPHSEHPPLHPDHHPRPDSHQRQFQLRPRSTCWAAAAPARSPPSWSPSWCWRSRGGWCWA
jgi:hypothetical protein